jgi:hypothetical protein
VSIGLVLTSDIATKAGCFQAFNTSVKALDEFELTPAIRLAGACVMAKLDVSHRQTDNSGVTV